MRWIVGDVQGCAGEFEELLRGIRFDSARDELWSVGDLVNRGPDSLAAVRLWKAVGGRGVIGNHEINALLIRSGRKRKKPKSLAELFAASDADRLLADLRALPALVHLPAAGKGPAAWVVHAGLNPRWHDLSETAVRLNAAPHDDDWLESSDVAFATTVRFCSVTGERSDHTGSPDACPPGFAPWDSFYAGPTLVVHGHWATRGHYRTAHVLGLDSGCVYGGSLTAWCQDEDRIVQVPSGSRR